MKDNFSDRSDQYARYRPHYPEDVFNYLKALVPDQATVWDCGTGTGQVAIQVAKFAQKVYATDISQEQLNNASKAENIEYSVQAAERTSFPDSFFDLVMVAQAIHWFDFYAFYSEVNRVVKEEGMICVLGYGRIRVTPKIDGILDDFYGDMIGPYWDPERKWIDEEYKTIPFPFKEIKTPTFENELGWNLAHFTGYLRTWSAVKHYIKKNGVDPVNKLESQLLEIWNADKVKMVRFPILLRLGRIN